MPHHRLGDHPGLNWVGCGIAPVKHPVDYPVEPQSHPGFAGEGAGDTINSLFS
jgi:hypothetical protein